MNLTYPSDVSDNINRTDSSITYYIGKIIYFGIVPIVAFVGIILNAVCFTMFWKMKTKSSTVIYLTGLAAADIFILVNGLLVTTMTASGLYQIPFTRNQYRGMMTYIAPYVVIIPGKIGNILTLLISFEKLLSVIIPLKVRQYSTKRSAVKAVIFSFVFPPLLCIPNLFFFSDDTINTNNTNITTDRLSFSTVLRKTNLEYQNRLYILQEVLLRFVPVFGVTINNILTCMIVVSSARNRSTISAPREGSSQEAQVTKTLLIITSVFSLCNLPTAISRLLIIARIGTNDVSDLASTVLHIFLLLNSVVNFFVYYTANEKYKAQLKEMCKCCKPGNHIQLAPEIYILSTYSGNNRQCLNLRI